MARGFESKSVQSQWQDAEDRAAERLRKRKAPGEHERDQKRSSLTMSRTRVAHDLEHARTETHRQTLRAALAHLDAQLAALDAARNDEP